MPCKIVFAKPEHLDMWLNHLSFYFYFEPGPRFHHVHQWLLKTFCERCNLLYGHCKQYSIVFGSISSKTPVFFLLLCCEDSRITGKQKYENDKGAHLFHLLSKRYSVVSSNWFRLCKSCSGLCCIRENLLF